MAACTEKQVSEKKYINPKILLMSHPEINIFDEKKNHDLQNSRRKSKLGTSQKHPLMLKDLLAL